MEDNNKEIRTIDEVKQLADKVEQLKKDHEYSIIYNFKSFFRILITEIISKKDFINFVAILFGVTGIFLNINKDVDYIKNLQAILLSISLLSFIILSLKIFSKLFRKYMGYIEITFLYFYASINLFLIYNVYEFIKLNYANELWELTKYLSLPLVFLGFSFILILIYKWNKQSNRIKDFNSAEYLIMGILAIGFWSRLSSREYDLYQTFLSYTNIHQNITTYLFIVLYLCDSFGLFLKFNLFKKLITSRLKKILFDILFVGIPTGLYYVIKYLLS